MTVPAQVQAPPPTRALQGRHAPTSLAATVGQAEGMDALGRLQGDQALPTTLRALANASRGRSRLDGPGRWKATALFALWPALAILAETRLTDSVPTVSFLAMALTLATVVHLAVVPFVKAWRTRLPADLGPQAPAGSLQGVVEAPEDPLLRAMAAQAWLVWDPPARVANLALPLAVLDRAASRLAAAGAALDRLEEELSAGVLLLEQVAQVGEHAAARAATARDRLQDRREQGRLLRGQVRAALEEVELCRAPLRDARDMPGPVASGPRVTRLSMDLAPVLERVEALLLRIRMVQVEPAA